MTVTTTTIRTTTDEIVLDEAGTGPALVLVQGAMQVRATDEPTRELVAELARRGWHAISYDRPGRGDSHGIDDLARPGLAREVAALEAVIGHAGGRAAVYGSSSGGAIALAAAAGGALIAQLVLWEPPLGADGSSDGAGLVERLRAVPEGPDASEAVIGAFMEGLPPQWLDGIRGGEHWAVYEAMGRTLIGDAEALAWTESVAEGRRWGALTLPVAVLVGEDTFAPLQEAADTLLHHLPHARRRTVSGAQHTFEPVAQAAAVVESLDDRTGGSGA